MALLLRCWPVVAVDAPGAFTVRATLVAAMMLREAEPLRRRTLCSAAACMLLKLKWQQSGLGPALALTLALFLWLNGWGAFVKLERRD